ncbi:pseudouridine-5'-phosphate glycosidase [Haematococcus lacustris]
MLRLSSEVLEALRKGTPVVALESTIISHGMPFPQNLHTALEVEAVVRAGGAVPATIAVIAGVPCVGLSREQLEHIARKGPEVSKVSRRDLPVVLAKQLDGATTVSATMLLAAAAGIRVFVTGGIGGVHRGGESSLDISADLTELGRTPVAVVCAGVKSVLDIPRTLEVLETQGVCVAAYQVDEFPAFFTPHSGCKAPCRVDSPAEAARLLHSSMALGLGGGLLLAVPIPLQHAAEGQQVEAAIQQALTEADERHVTGSQITPFLLERIRDLTGGRSLDANIKLVKNNAAVGAAVAVQLSNLTTTCKL